MNKQRTYTKDEIHIEKIPSTRVKDLSGRNFGKWHVIGYAGNNDDHKSMWWCFCECNKDIFYKIVGTELSRNKTTSCGCNIIESNKQRSFINKNAQFFGLTRNSYDRICRIHKHMCRRCTDPSDKDYPHYGGRGISVCNEWMNNKDYFIEWCVNNGYDDSLTIERVDVNKDYMPSNCTWITMIEQAANKTTTKYVLYHGEEIKLIDLLKSIGCNTHKEQNKVRCRIFRYGWPVERAIKEYI